jgi:hypothetical protein
MDEPDGVVSPDAPASPTQAAGGKPTDTQATTAVRGGGEGRWST